MIDMKYSHKNIIRLSILSIALLAIVILSSCSRGTPTSQPAIHLNPNMDYQPKYQPLEYSEHFDGPTMRMPIKGTIARNNLRADSRYYLGKNSDGTFVQKFPIEITSALLDRGQERFNIYCSPCHSKIGDGRGIMIEYNYIPPASIHIDRLRNVEDGYLFDVITNGIRNMPRYANQVPVSDRWAIISYIRALQRSQNAQLSDIPEEHKDSIR